MDCANEEVNERYSIIDFLEPRNVIFCHWEDFFRSKAETPHEIVKVDLLDLKARLPSTASTRYLFPAWDATFDFPPT